MSKNQNLKKVTLKLEGSEFEKFKVISAKLIETYQLEVSSMRYGEVGDSIIVSFNIPGSQYFLVIEKLTLNNFNILYIDEKVRKEIGHTSKVTTGSIDQNIWQESKTKQYQLSNSALEELTEKGNYKELVKIATDFKSAGDQKEKANSLIDPAVRNAVNLAIKKSEKGKYAALEAIDELISIAADINLKNLHKIDLIKAAGLTALDITVSDPFYYEDLIELCSNSKVHYLVTMKAFAMFSKLILKNQDTFQELLVLSKRKINTRWIRIAYDVVYNDMDYEEKNLISELLEYFETNK